MRNSHINSIQLTLFYFLDDIGQFLFFNPHFFIFGLQIQFFEDPIISTSIKGSKEYCDAINYLLDKNKYELWKKHDGHFNDSLNCVSAHRTTYHILHILKKYHNIDWDWIPDFIYTNHYHSSSFNFCRHLYFGHLDFNHRRGNDPMYDNMEQRETLQLPENIELIKNYFTLNI